MRGNSFPTPSPSHTPLAAAPWPLPGEEPGGDCPGDDHLLTGQDELTGPDEAHDAVPPVHLALHVMTPHHLVKPILGVNLRVTCKKKHIHFHQLTGYPDSKFHGANMGPSGADRTQVGPMLASWTLLSG